MSERTCSWCGEEVDLADQANVTNGWIHIACAVRSVIGSVAHLKKQCSCYGGTENDSPDLSRRQAAEEAFKLWKQLERAKLLRN